MLEHGSVSIWIDQLKAGEQDAAQKLWDRYYRRLMGLARKKLADSPRAVSDEDDVTQSVFHSFCARAQAGQFPDLRNRDNLWPLLVVITARKAANHRKHQGRAKRGGGRIAHQSAGATDSALQQFAAAIADDPSPDDAAIFLGELERLMNSLDDPTHRAILLWKLEERTNSEIARHLDCSESGIERKVRLIRKLLAREIPNE